LTLTLFTPFSFGVQVYRSAKSKDDAKLSAIRQELEADFASKSTADISTVIENHKQELTEFAKVAE